MNSDHLNSVELMWLAIDEKPDSEAASVVRATQCTFQSGKLQPPRP